MPLHPRPLTDPGVLPRAASLSHREGEFRRTLLKQPEHGLGGEIWAGPPFSRSLGNWIRLRRESQQRAAGGAQENLHGRGGRKVRHATPAHSQGSRNRVRTNRVAPRQTEVDRKSVV